MGEIPTGFWHQREAARFKRLAELCDRPSLKQKLSRIAALHERVAIEIEMIGGISSVRQGAAQKVGERGAEPYQLYFLDGRDILATHVFEAGTDIAALAVAYTLLDACSDISDHFELWRGVRVIARSSDRRGPKRVPHLHAIASQTQACVLDNEELLLNSHQTIAESRKLLRETELLRSKLSVHT